MYYLGSNKISNYSEALLYIYYAVSTDDGATWQDKGLVKFTGVKQPLYGEGVYIDSPSVIREKEGWTFFFARGNGTLFKAYTSNGLEFEVPKKTSVNMGIIHGTVTKFAGRYYLIYARNAEGSGYNPPVSIAIAASDTEYFANPGTILITGTGGGIANVGKDSERYYWTPFITRGNGGFYLYYASGSSPHRDLWMLDSDIVSTYFEYKSDVQYMNLPLNAYWCEESQDYYYSSFTFDKYYKQDGCELEKTEGVVFSGPVSGITLKNNIDDPLMKNDPKIIYELWNPYYKDQYLTINTSEVKEYTKSGWINTGAIGYAFPSSNNSAIESKPLYMVWCANTNDHLYFTDKADYDSSVAGGCSAGGVVMYIGE